MINFFEVHIILQIFLVIVSWFILRTIIRKLFGKLRVNKQIEQKDIFSKWSYQMFMGEAGAIILGLIVLGYQIIMHGSVNWLQVGYGALSGVIIFSSGLVDRLAKMLAT